MRLPYAARPGHGGTRSINGLRLAADGHGAIGGHGDRRGKGAPRSEAATPGRLLRRPAHDGRGSRVGDVVVFGAHAAALPLPGRRGQWARRRAGGRWHASGEQGAQPLYGGQPAGARRWAGGSTSSTPGASGCAGPAARVAGARRHVPLTARRWPRGPGASVPPSRRGRPGRDRRGHGARCKAVPARGAGCGPRAESERGPARRARRIVPSHPRDEGTKHCRGYSSRAFDRVRVHQAQQQGTAPSGPPLLAATQRNLTVEPIHTPPSPVEGRVLGRGKGGG